MQYVYAEKFKNMAEAEIDRVLQSFAFEHCVPHANLVAILKRYLPGGKTSPTIG